MTTEQRLILDLTDVLAIRLDCQQCATAVVFKPSDWNNAPFVCPGCQTPWELPTTAESGFTPINYLGLGLRRLLEQISPSQGRSVGSTKGPIIPAAPKMPYRVRIEIKDPLAGSTK